MTKKEEEFLFYCNGTKSKPLFRGIIHEALLFVTPLWAIPILFACQTTRAYLSVVMYILSYVFCHGISSQYHRRSWTFKEEKWMAKMDNLAIFVLMTFSAAPVFILLIPEVGIPTLSIMSIGCILWYFLFVVYDYHLNFNRYIMSALYFALGISIGITILPEFTQAANFLEIVSWCLGGWCYIVGAWIYATKYPEPWPGIFGHHEIFHLLTAGAAAFTFLANYSVVKRIG